MTNKRLHPFFSIITPVYNGDKYLFRCISSILSQTFHNYEAIIIDDGSTDDGIKIIESFRDPRIRLAQQNHKGVSAARNLGIVNSYGSIIVFLDADDEWCPNHLETLANLIMTNDKGGLYSTGYRLLQEDGTWPVDTFVDSKGMSSIIIEDPFPFWSICHVNHSSNTAIPRTILSEVGLFEEGVAENEDLDLWIRIAMRYSTVYSPSVTSIVHKTPSSGKPRFQSRPDCILACKTASRHLAGLSSSSKIKEQTIKRYIRAMIGRYFWGSVSKGQQGTINDILINSGAKSYAPMYLWVVENSWTWPFVNFACFLRSAFLSRLAQYLTGGKRKRRGIIFRLVNSHGCVNTYFDRLMRLL